MANELAATLGGVLNDQEAMKTELAETSDISTQFMINSYELKVVKSSFSITGREIGSGFILGHSTFGVIGATASNPLGSDGFGTVETLYDLTAESGITTVGKLTLASLIGSITDTGSRPMWLAYGAGSNAYSVVQTALGSEVDSRIFNVGRTGSAGIYALTYDVSIKDGNAREFGLFTGSHLTDDTGSMWHRQVIPSTLTLDSGSFYTIIYKIQVHDNTGGFGIIPTIGISKFTDWFVGSPWIAPSHIEWTNSSVLPDVSDVGLGSEASGTGSFRDSIIRRELRGNRVLLTSYIEADEMVGSTIRKTGIFDNATSGSLIAETIISPITKSSLLSIQQTDIITIS